MTWNLPTSHVRNTITSILVILFHMLECIAYRRPHHIHLIYLILSDFLPFLRSFYFLRKTYSLCQVCLVGLNVWQDVSSLTKHHLDLTSPRKQLIIEKEVLKSSTVIINLSISPSNFLSFYFIYFEVLLGVYISRLLILLNLPLYHYEKSITGNMTCSEIYLV